MQNKIPHTQEPAKPPLPPPPPPEPFLTRKPPPTPLLPLTRDNKPLHPPPTFPIYYFFYGTLTSPAQVARILDLPEEPRLRKAEVTGYAIAKWGDYPALIKGNEGQVVSGSAYLVKSEEEAQKLARYETNAYEVVDCLIFFKDGEQPDEASGKVFVYAGDAQALVERRFDRVLWGRQMGEGLR
ncbi:gamma-glutamylcyclotransferase family protein [Aspergillus neoniger CBS 115656]|uniref:Putative gamma-glutamylcyclotransferase n=1 Tax=Aspergillus neoniger (strain CBS 115656) TaxID=1448310 RepID=A0A318Y892_ASPNB|nr:hypothetical protein BO87DRAFT_380009 [Aspergillus neoniger CBS 115656]PYH30159.1 hypothetical protein BO87DRAFT_380009 [Aspergillus neoniger CBS 115656]